MFDFLAEMFSFAFLTRAVIVGLLVSLCAALLGVSLVLKRYSMIGTGLSQVGFGALAIATVLHASPLMVSIPVVVLVAFLLLRISENGKIKGDAAVALIATSSLAIGVVVMFKSASRNSSADVCNFMFGSVLNINKSEVLLSIPLTIVVLVLFILCYNKIFAVTFDETFARATGAKAELYNMLIAVLTAVTIVLGMRVMGALLISSLIIFPALTSMRLCKTFLSVTICSAIVSVTCFFLGMVGAYKFETPPGASVIIVNIVAFFVFWALASLPMLRMAAGRKRIEK